jgi:archaetidylinositol phosphate synthase
LLRIHNTLFSSLERKALVWLARRLPTSVTPDIVTAFGIFGSFVALVGFALSSLTPSFLWLASLGIVFHWLGDSLDGTLARVRKIERPKYGYFLDQTVDVIGNLLIAVGMGLSPFVRMDVALFALAGYHALSIYSFVRTCVSNEFHVSLLGSGPTEIRMLIIGMNSFILLFGAPQFSIFGLWLTWCDVALLAMATVFMIAFVFLVASYAAAISKIELRDKL